MIKRMLRNTLLFVGIAIISGFVLVTVNRFEQVTEAGKIETANPKKYSTNLSEDAWVKQELSKLSTTEKIAQSFMVACWSNRGQKHIDALKEQIANDKIGGVIFFQGDRQNLKNTIGQLDQATTLPLLYGMDAEWGVAMRLSKENRFPYLQTVGAANDTNLTNQLGFEMGKECAEFNIHINFAPDADVNNNPNNPVIGFRAFGESPQQVAQHTAAFVRGMEASGTLSCIKHFPGHGDTDKDSHLDLPTISKSKSDFEQNEFVPFQAGIGAGTRAVMIAHLNVPQLDPSGTPSSLSKVVIQDYLRKQMNFKGLVISDALNMKAIANRYGKEEAVAMAYEAGCDILLFPESVHESIELISKKVKSGKITLEEVNEHCSKVLHAKYKALFGKVKRSSTANDKQLMVQQICEKSMVVLKNEDNVLPIDRMDEGVSHVSIGPAVQTFHDRLNDYGPIAQKHYYTCEEAAERLKKVNFTGTGAIILDLHATTQRTKNNYGFGDWESVVKALPANRKVIVVFFGNANVLRTITTFPSNVKAVVVAHENLFEMQDRVAQFIVGAFDCSNTLQTSYSSLFPKGTGVSVKGNGRLKYTVPEELGISAEKMKEIDAIVTNGIEAKAFPGCQVVVAVEGKIIHQRAYGKTMYENGDSITNEHIYDIASITKIASSTAALMKLASEGKFTPEMTLGQLVPEFTNGTPYAALRSKDLLTHQAGLTPWIAFYKKTIDEGKLNPAIYHTKKEGVFTIQVADDIFIDENYHKTMLKTIVETPLSGMKKYEYSDLSYYFYNQFIERTTGMGQEGYVQKAIYGPLGLQRMTYLPLQKFKRSMIVPTENDKEFRKQLIHGYVHDPGAAMMGGVAGHAGLFSTATDLAMLMQLFINQGQLGDQSIISKDIVNNFTKCQFCPSNRRGLGFDKPAADGSGGPVTSMTSLSSYGHSGFTGTLTWADPEYQINYVFLSNRVCPSAENWKIRDMNIRTNIQKVIYEAVKSRKK